MSVANLSQNVRHSVRGQNMQISTVDVKVCKTYKPSQHLRGISEGIGSFLLPEGLF